MNRAEIEKKICSTKQAARYYWLLSILFNFLAQIGPRNSEAVSFIILFFLISITLLILAIINTIEYFRLPHSITLDQIESIEKLLVRIEEKLDSGSHDGQKVNS